MKTFYRIRQLNNNISPSRMGCGSSKSPVEDMKTDNGSDLDIREEEEDKTQGRELNRFLLNNFHNLLERNILSLS